MYVYIYICILYIYLITFLTVCWVFPLLWELDLRVVSFFGLFQCFAYFFVGFVKLQFVDSSSVFAHISIFFIILCCLLLLLLFYCCCWLVLVVVVVGFGKEKCLKIRMFNGKIYWFQYIKRLYGLCVFTVLLPIGRAWGGPGPGKRMLEPRAVP